MQSQTEFSRNREFQDVDPSPLLGNRFLLVSTPRSGNTWFRTMVRSILGISETAVHSSSDLNWDSLPDGFIVQMHWRRTPTILDLIGRLRMQPVVIVRHPLDVLISILHFCTFEPQTARWLEGEGGSEGAIIGRTPADPAFREYALSPRVGALLGVSPEWVNAGCTYVRYERLVASPVTTLSTLLRGQRFATSIETVVSECTIERLRGTCANNHFWRGQPGLWRSLISKEAAQEIYAQHRSAFDPLGYTIKGATDLSLYEIEEEWERS